MREHRTEPRRPLTWPRAGRPPGTIRRRDPPPTASGAERSEEHTSELQSQSNLVCRLLLEKKKKNRERHRASAVWDRDRRRTRTTNPTTRSCGTTAERAGQSSGRRFPECASVTLHYPPRPA